MWIYNNAQAITVWDFSNFAIILRNGLFWKGCYIIEDYHGMKEEQQKRLVAYMEALKKIESLEEMEI